MTISMTTHRSLTAFAVTILCAVLSSCASTAGIEASSLAVTGPQGETTYTNTISVANRQLARELAIVKVDQRDIGGLVRAAVQLTSRIDDTLAVQYRFVWFDSHGMEVGSGSQPWQPLLIYGGQTTSVQGLAPNPGAKSFKIHVRYQE